MRMDITTCTYPLIKIIVFVLLIIAIIYRPYIENAILSIFVAIVSCAIVALAILGIYNACGELMELYFRKQKMKKHKK